MTLNAWTGGPDPSSPQKDRPTGIPPKLTPEQIDTEYRDLPPPVQHWQLARAIESAVNQQWLAMLAAAPGVEKIMDMLDNFEYAVLGVMQGRRSPDEPAQMKADIRTAIEQALAYQCAQLVLERDELLKQVQRYEKHGVTCQTYRHHVAGCGECNNEAPQPPQQPATGFGPKLIPQVSGFVAPQPPQQPAEWVGLTEADKMMLLPVVRLRGEDPKPQVWLTRNDAFAYADAIDTKLREKNTENKQ